MSGESRNCSYKMSKNSVNGVNFVNTAKAYLGPCQKTMINLFLDNS